MADTGMPDLKKPVVKEKKPGGGGSLSGGTGSGTDEAKERKVYMQRYLSVIARNYGRFSFSKSQQKLADQAFKYRQPASVFADLLRRKDPEYVKTANYKARSAEAKELYQRFRPTRNAPHEFVQNYARSEMTAQRLIRRIESSRWFKREMPGWAMARKSGLISASATSGDAMSFMRMRDMLTNSFKQYGVQVTPQMQRLMFSAGMDENAVAGNLTDLFGGQAALKWATGKGMDSNEILRAALSKRFGGAALGQVVGSRATMGNFLGSKNRTFDLGVSEQTGDITAARI